jgi:hypothetical protein
VTACFKRVSRRSGGIWWDWSVSVLFSKSKACWNCDARISLEVVIPCHSLKDGTSWRDFADKR